MLPLELWTQICSLACSDGGHTGRVLSLVSRALHQASKPFKLRSVAVRGVPQIVGFARYLESLPAEHRNVDNLYIATCAADFYTVNGSLPSFQALVDLYKPGICDRTPGPEPEEILEGWEELFAHACSRILTSVSSTVRIAHVSLEIYRDFIFFPVKFQRLEELSIRGPFDCSDEGYISHLPAIPTLRHLKLSPTTLYDSTTLLPSITAYAPHLTHLYCQISNPYHSGIIAQLDRIFHPTSLDNPDQFPHSLKKLYLHPGKGEPPAMCGGGYASLLTAKERLFSYYMSEPRIVLFKQTSVWGREEGEEEWLERIGGGLGCWDESNQMDRLF